MKNNQSKYLQVLVRLSGLALMLSFTLPFSAKADPLDFATSPLANTPTQAMSPNLLFIYDDSLSMSFDYMPDWVDDSGTDATLQIDAAYNTVYYNPAILYSPPAYFGTSGLDTTKYPSQIGVSVATGGSSGATSGAPNWKKVKSDPYRSSSTTDLQAKNGGTGPNFYVTVPSEHCTKADLRVCVASEVPTTTHTFPAPVRWCNSNANATATTPATGSCQATRVGTFDFLRIPLASGPAGVAIGTVTINNAWQTPRINGITVAGQQIMSWRTGQTNGESSLATQARDRINQCENGIPGWASCTISGYRAQVSGSTITIYAPTPTTASPVVSYSNGGMNFTTTVFSLPTASPGDRLNTTITSGNNSYPYPGKTSASGERTDCGAVCTYAQEMTNYANWYAYYRTRTLMMKTATSLAFKNIGDNFRVGFMTTSTQSARSLDIDTFDTTHKAAWYAKLFSAQSDRFTPLRGSLATAGRIFANKTTAGGVFSDPIQYECQQNFALLTTDGFWNTNDEASYTGGPVGVDGNNVGNRDSQALGTPLGMREGVIPRANTLADVAKYYRDTDLRTPAGTDTTKDFNNCTGALGSSVCQTPAVSGGNAQNVKQTMRTLTLGLGVDGVLAYTADYEKDPGSYLDLKNESANWSDPDPEYSGPFGSGPGAERIDDLWHAAVNGEGKYFSAKNPSDVVKQLQEAIASITVTVGAGSAAATSSLNPIAGNDYAYLASYTSGHWTGNLERRLIAATGLTEPVATHCVEDIVVTSSCASPSAVQGDGTGKYNCVTPGISDPANCAGSIVGTECHVPVAKVCTGTLRDQISDFTTTRTIRMNVGGSLGDFRYSNFSTAQQETFDEPFLTLNLTQWGSLTANQKGNATGEYLVNYLRGETGYEQSSSTADNRVFRKREATFGDVVTSRPAFVGQPTFNFGDPGYQAYKSSKSGRDRNVYVGSNDGMLHAFDADTLEERWAYVPSMVIPNLWKIADTNYSAIHAYYVDGSIEVSDICVSGCAGASAVWKTILVAGLNGGGRGYYALDITDPLSPVLLWEFDASNTLKGDSDLGYTYGNPFVTKRNSDGKWVVLFTSGYNNIPDDDSFYNKSTTLFKPNNPAIFTGGNGRGYLFVLNAVTGLRLSKIPTNVGNTTTPSGLAKITAYVDDPARNNTTENVYAGDLEGNIWRFDIDAETAFKVTNLSAGGVPQPITTRLELGAVNAKRVLFVGTGKYLEIADLTGPFDQQSLYAIQDDNAVTTLTSPRATLVKQTITLSTTNVDERVSGGSDNVDFDLKRGWYIDLPDSGERQNIAARLILGTLIVPTIVPESSACQPAGYGWLNYLDYKTGRQVPQTTGSNVVSSRLADPSVGFSLVVNEDGEVVGESRGVTGEVKPFKPPVSGSISGFQLKRSIWREIIE